MASSASPAQQDERPQIHIVGLSVYLSNPNTSPSLVNPDFLRHNGIVDSSWAVTRPVVIDHARSQISYSNGLTFVATNSHTVVSQRFPRDENSTRIIPLTSDNIVCFRVASRYLDSVSPESPYDLFSIDPSGVIEIDLKEMAELSSPLQELGSRISFEEQTPEVQARAQYEISEKSITIYISEVPPPDDSDLLRLFFSGEIIYDIDENNTATQGNAISDILENWEQDIQLFRELVYQIFSTYVPQEQ